MIVEDDKIISEELTHLLETSGYNVITLTNYDNTLEDILNSNFDLLLLDINLPKVNGEFLLKEIRKVSNVPIIMLTSRALETDEVLSMSYGADDYITKPYNPTILLLRIANIFRRMEKNVNSLNYDDIKVYKKEMLCNPSSSSKVIHVFTGTWMEGAKPLKRKIVKFFKLRIKTPKGAQLYSKWIARDNKKS